MKAAPTIITRDMMDNVLGDANALIGAIERGFVAYSQGHVVVPPVGELLLPERNGEVHIKYGAVRGDWCYLVKIASGFYSNSALGLPSTDGLMLAFDQVTGALAAILLDDGYLTDVRTAIAGAIAAKHLAPSTVSAIGIVGTGAQARLQAHWLKHVTPCRHIHLWGRSGLATQTCAADLKADGFTVDIEAEANYVLAKSNLVVTTTPSELPLLTADALHAGLHITAMGSDGPHKQELDALILGAANRIVADSRSQCQERGEIAKAIAQGVITMADVAELGEVIIGTTPGRRSDNDITVADLTGVAVQDIEIAKAVMDGLGIVSTHI
jgi:ornithine cyclodeaminase